MAVTNRKLVQFSGSTLAGVTGLTGDNAIQDRELLVSTDTQELFLGSGGKPVLIGRCIISDVNPAVETATVSGRAHLNTVSGILYISDGTQWVPTGVSQDVTDAFIQKVTGGTENNITTLTADGSVKDSGISISDTLTTATNVWSSLKVSQSIHDAIKGLSWQTAVKTFLDVPPTTPTTGDRYVIKATATEAWVGKENSIAEWSGTEWTFITPFDGMALWTQDDDKYHNYNGTAWVEFGSGMVYTGGNGVDITGSVVSVKSIATSAVEVTATGVDVKVNGTEIIKNATSGKLEIGSLDFGSF